MRQGSNNGRRPRGRANRKQHGGGPSRSHTFDSNGPDGRVRGNARQVYEKYLSLARDASSAGDRIAAEAYYQHAEHYFRILSDSTDPSPAGRRPEDRQPQPYHQENGDFGEDDDDPVNGHGGGERHHEARSNGSPAPQAPREHHDREQPPDQQPREHQPRETQTSSVEGDSAGHPQGQGRSGKDENQQRRRGRPRKPRTDEEGQTSQQEAASEPESGPTVS